MEASRAIVGMIRFTNSRLSIRAHDGIAGFVFALVAGVVCLATAGRLSAQQQPAPAPKLAVHRYEVRGNTVLTESVMEGLFRAHTGTNLGISEIVQAASDLQMEYRRRGFPTISVALPPQQITNGVVQVQVTEGQLAEIKVTGNRHFSSDNVARALPSLRTNTLLNSHVFQAELDRANGSRDRQIFPQIEPGPETNTSAIVLEVKDRFPLHGRLDLNNIVTPGSPEFRLNVNASYDNLWQREHSIGLQYGFSPFSYKPAAAPGLEPNFVEAPTVANYSLFYRAPLSGARAVTDEVSSEPKRYGYNEATRRFELPPTSGRAELSAYASRSSTDLTTRGPISTVVDTALLRIDNQIATRSVTRDVSSGLRFSMPQANSGQWRATWSAGFDYKDHAGVTYPSNVFYSTATITNSSGLPDVREDTTAVPSASSEQNYSYLSVVLGWQGTRPDKWGLTSGSINLTAGSAAPLTGLADFRNNSGPSASEQFVVARVRVSRDQEVIRNWRVSAAVEGQLASQSLVSLEQFGIGGLGSVRGYQEGEVYGDDGFYAQFEIKAPPFSRRETLDGRAVGVGTTVSFFTDYGRVFLKEPRGRESSSDLWGAGLAGSAFFGKHFESRFVLGWSLIDSNTRASGVLLFSFSLGTQF